MDARAWFYLGVLIVQIVIITGATMLLGKERP